MMASRKDGLIRDPRVHQSFTRSSIYLPGRAPQRTITTVRTPIVCMVLFQFIKQI